MDQFQTTIIQGKGGGSVSRSDCEKQGGNHLGFCPNYVQEFGLSSHLLELSVEADCTIYLALSSANLSSVFHPFEGIIKYPPQSPQLPPGRVM